MGIMQDMLFLGDSIPRARISSSAIADLDLSRLVSQYFLRNGNLPKVISREFYKPPTESQTIISRQRLVETLMSDEEKLEELNGGLVEIHNGSNTKPEMEFINYHPTVSYYNGLKRISAGLPQISPFSDFKCAIDDLILDTGLAEVVERAKRVIGADTPATISITNHTITFEINGHLTTNQVSNLGQRINEIHHQFSTELASKLPILNPIMNDLFDALAYYVCLANYGRFLQDKNLYVMPSINNQQGYLDARGFYNPLLVLGKPDFFRNPRGQLPKFSESITPHDYPASEQNIHIALGRNGGSKSTWITGRGELQLMAQSGSPIPGQYCEIGPVNSISTVYVRQVDIGSGQSVFTRILDQLGDSFDLSKSGGLMILDDATEGTDPANSQNLMDFILRTVSQRNITAFLATQDRRLQSVKDLQAVFYTTVPGSYAIRRLEGTQVAESVNWRQIAAATKLGPYLKM